jgi:predicted RNA binding protein YcfA (HicA-like mRNA interferase family)
MLRVFDGITSRFLPSHIILRRREPPHRRLSVPDHKELAKGTLRSLIRQAGLTVDQFRALL